MFVSTGEELVVVDEDFTIEIVFVPALLVDCDCCIVVNVVFLVVVLPLVFVLACTAGCTVAALCEIVVI